MTNIRPSLLAEIFVCLNKPDSGRLHRAFGKIMYPKFICQVSTDHCVDESLVGCPQIVGLEALPNFVNSTGILDRVDKLLN